MRALGEPDAFPAGDLGLLRALRIESFPELERRAEAWRPWRAYATMYLWTVAEAEGVLKIAHHSGVGPRPASGSTAQIANASAGD